MTGETISRARALGAFYLFLFLAMLLPLYLLSSLGPLSVGWSGLLAWLVLGYAGFRLAAFSARGEPRLLNLSFWVFVYVWLGLAPLLQIAHGQFPLAGFYPPAQVRYALIVILAGLAAYELGFHLTRSRISSFPNLEQFVFRRNLDSRRVIVLAIVSIVLTSILFAALGGASRVLTSRNEFFAIVNEFTGDQGQAKLQLFFTLLIVPPFLSFYLLWVLWLKRNEGFSLHTRLLVVALMLALLTINALINNPVNSARYWFGTIAFSLAFVTVPWKRSFSFPLWTLSLVLLLLFVFPYADLFRRSVQPEEMTYRGWEPIVDKGDFDGFQQTVNAVVFVNENGLSLGKQFLGTLLFWVPRSAWPGKPLPSSEMVATNMGYGYTNLSLPLWGEAYLDGGLALVVLLFLFYGSMVRIVEDASLRDDAQRLTLLGLFVPIYAAYQFFLLRGTLMSAFAYLIPVVVLLVLHTRSAAARDARAEEAGGGKPLLRPGTATPAG